MLLNKCPATKKKGIKCNVSIDFMGKSQSRLLMQNQTSVCTYIYLQLYISQIEYEFYLHIKMLISIQVTG